jgi:hypothetical protein
MRSTIAVAVASLVLLSAGAANAAIGDRCEVTNPAGNAAHVRSTSQGIVVGTIPNGMKVTIMNEDKADDGREWVWLYSQNGMQPLGWVPSDLLTCE